MYLSVCVNWDDIKNFTLSPLGNTACIRTHLVLAHVGGAHEDGEDEVHEEVEGDEGDEEVVRLRRQLRLVQLHREEDRHDPHDLNGGSAELGSTRRF